MTNKQTLTLALTALLMAGCSSNSPDDLEGEIPANVTYTEHVRPIIESNCLSCHGEPQQNSAPMALTDYDKVKEYVSNGKLLDRISRAQGAEGMMPNGGTRLPQTKIDIIAKWQAQNFQN
ncbi:hypothetical protein [Flavobacterium sp.]|uniref:c-type cytochrome n=1 Tax=Flavobacterium sp. TaxID=239 RepID=UPI0026264D72|nr:hypothetical protein [Flavobacterium sp.]